MDRVTQGVKGAAAAAKNRATSTASAVTRGATSTFSKTSSVVTKGASTVSKGATSTFTNASSAVTKGASTVTKGATSAVTKGASTVTKGASNVTKGATSAVTNASKGARQKLTKANSAVFKAFKNDMSSSSNGLEPMQSRRSMSMRQVEPKAPSGVILGLMEKRVTAVVKDLDHYRKRGKLVVETDYIVHIKGVTSHGETDFGYAISKTFAAFRSLSDKLYSEAEDVMRSSSNLPKNVVRLAKYCHAIHRLIESQHQEYLGKLNYNYIQTMAKQRSVVINNFLKATMNHFPDQAFATKEPFARRIATHLEKFFLTDLCEGIEGEGEEDLFGKIIHQPIRKNYHTIDKGSTHFLEENDDEMIQNAVKTRRTKEERIQEERELAKSNDNFYLEGGQSEGNSSGEKKKISHKAAFVKFVDNSPLVSLAGFAGAMQVLRALEFLNQMEIEWHTFLLIAFCCFTLGVHATRLVGIQQEDQSAPDRTAALMRRSLAASSRGLGGGDDEEVIDSPMKRFPDGAKLGSVLNRWSDPPSTNFNVRGDHYLSDKQKIKSGPFLFKTRGVDLFLTDQCPENVGRIPSLMGGDLRSVPTFIINFRLPWGVLLFYFEIPERFVPYIKGCYGDKDYRKDILEASMRGMSGPDRCCARFLLRDDEYKNNNLKIFPSVVEGPWVAKASIGGKPAIIGTKLPVSYVYSPEGNAADGSRQALYLEADLDVVSNATARGILSVVKSCTQDLTLDLGFAVQGNSEDELPEQMLTGTRIHGIDPLNAQSLPPLTDTLLASNAAHDSDSDSDDESDD